MTIACSGSVAFDHIMTFPGHFQDHILPDKVHILNVSFLVDSLTKRRGGTAANIAYNLALLGEKAQVVATVGEDFEEYRGWLERAGVDTKATRVVPGDFTASGFITTDLSDNQITGFYIGAMRAAATVSLKELAPRPALVCVSPNDPAAMDLHVNEARALGIPWVYDPGQQIVRLEGEQLVNGMRGARCVVGNDYEIAMIASKTGYSEDRLGELAAMVVVTKGEHGSVVHERGRTTNVPAAKPKRVLDPTGAGDAYRAGLLRGLLRGESVETWGRVAALSAAYAVEQRGTQEHAHTPPEFNARMKAAF
ncbi:MAG: carbohydrate kinase family protein [Chloroflexi bacterium]|nr:carbohydrate kinase family protein [Chloroflexota bacterium]